MTEAYLHYIWKYRLFNTNQLKTSKGEQISIKNYGIHNPNAGPDFLEARLTIGEKEWAGNIEIHLASSDWLKHNHHTDGAYNNVVLHVVYENDMPVKYSDGSNIPTLELKGLFDEMGYWRYEQFISNQRFLACENLLNTVEEIHLKGMLDRMLVDRLEQKAQFVKEIYNSTGNDWNETFYRMLFYAFGLRINSDAMLALVEQLPLKILRAGLIVLIQEYLYERNLAKHNRSNGE